jgi:hypothetical protein
VADVTKVDDFIALGSEEACKVAGKTTTQGKDYIVAGAIALSFRSNLHSHSFDSSLVISLCLLLQMGT